MSDMTHSEAEEALAIGDEQDVEEALEAEREEAEAPPEEAAMGTSTTEALIEEVAAEDEAELEAIADVAVAEEVEEEVAEVVAEEAAEEIVGEIVEEIVEEAVLEAIEEAVAEEIAEEITDEIAAGPPPGRASRIWCSTPPRARKPRPRASSGAGAKTRKRKSSPSRAPTTVRVAGTWCTPILATRTRCVPTWATWWHHAASRTASSRS